MLDCRYLRLILRRLEIALGCEVSLDLCNVYFSSLSSVLPKVDGLTSSLLWCYSKSACQMIVLC